MLHRVQKNSFIVTLGEHFVMVRMDDHSTAVDCFCLWHMDKQTN